MLLDTLHTGDFVSVYSERNGEVEEDLEAVYQEAQLERQQLLIDALRKAKAGTATEDDWSIICYECGIKKEFVWD